MAKLVAKAYNPTNGSVEEIYEGYSFECLLIGPFWYARKAMWGLFAISTLSALCTFGLSLFIFPARANAHFANFLLREGWLTEKQWLQKSNSNAQPSPSKTGESVSSELERLHNLKESGALTLDEFEKLKAKLLN